MHSSRVWVRTEDVWRGKMFVILLIWIIKIHLSRQSIFPLLHQWKPMKWFASKLLHNREAVRFYILYLLLPQENRKRKVSQSFWTSAFLWEQHTADARDSTLKDNIIFRKKLALTISCPTESILQWTPCNGKNGLEKVELDLAKSSRKV